MLSVPPACRCDDGSDFKHGGRCSSRLDTEPVRADQERWNGELDHSRYTTLGGGLSNTDGFLDEEC